MRNYKFRIYPTKKQETQMRQHLWIAKNLWNELLAFSKQLYTDYERFPTKTTLQRMVKKSGLYSQAQQEVAHRVSNSIFRVFRMKKQGKKCGFPRFKSIDRMKSLHYPQSGFVLDKKLAVSPFGELSIKKHREVEGKIKTLTLKREPSGKWFAIFCAEQEPHKPMANNGGAVGIDLGLKNLAMLSNGEVIKNPRHLTAHETKLAQTQRRLSRKTKGSANRKKAKLRVARQHEQVANARLDFLHKATTSLVNSYSLIGLEKLASQEMAQDRFGKQINDAGWGTLANMVAYKAESAGCQVVFVDAKNTTQECSQCHEIVKKTLADRTHDCPACGLSIDRDLNAARNILARATAGLAGRNACGDGTIVPPVKQEAQTLQGWE
jgi:putative transposase